MPKLTDNQRAILSAAATRDSLAVLPLPKSLKIKGGAATSVLKSLIKRELVTEQVAGPGEATWREDGEARKTLVLTPSGLHAVGAEPARASKARTASSSTTSLSVARPGTKQALLVDMLKRKSGATVAEVQDATGWQAHSVRGAISGAIKKKLGLTVVSEPVEGRGRVYRIVGPADMAA